MNDFILVLHFVGLMIGAAGGLASGIIMRRALTLPVDQAQVLRGLGPLLANVAAVGLAVMWISGVILVFSKWGGIGSLPGLFWVKLFFVVVLTALTGVAHMTYAEIRRTKNAALGARLAVIGPASGMASLLAVFFAVYTFS